jgi:dipeptide/tripeptide permease
MALGAVGGAIILSPANEYLGRRWAIILSCILYTIGYVLFNTETCCKSC